MSGVELAALIEECRLHAGIAEEQGHGIVADRYWRIIEALSRRAVPVEAVAWREKVEIVTEWLAMAKETPRPLHSSLNYVPISPSEIDAIDGILQALALIPAPGNKEDGR